MKKLLFGVLILSAVFLITAGFGFYYLKSNDFFFSEINQLLEENTGYVLDKSGAIEVVLLPHPKLTARKLGLNNPSSSISAEIFRTERLSLTLDWFSIFRPGITVDVELDATDIDLQVDETGAASWLTSELQGEGAALPFQLGKINARKTRFRFRNRQTQEILGLDLDQIEIDLVTGHANTRINTAGRYGKTRFLAQGELKYDTNNKQLEVNLGVRAGIAGDKNVAAIQVASVSNWIEQNVLSFPLRGKLDGSLSIENSLPYGRLNFNAETQSIGDFAHLHEGLTYLRGESGPIEASGVLQLNGSDLDITGLQAELYGQEQLKIQLNGTLQNLLSEPQPDLRVKGRVSRLDHVLSTSAVAAIDQKVTSNMENIDFDARFNKTDSGVRISDLDLNFSHRSINAAAIGTIEITSTSVLTDLKVTGEIDRVSDLMEIFDIEKNLLGDPGPFTMSVTFSGENDHYVIRHGILNTLDGHIKMRASGSLNAADGNLNFDLDNRLEVNDLSPLAEILPESYQPYLQGVGNVSAKIKGTVENFAISALEMDLSHDFSTLHLEGRLNQLPDNLIGDIEVRYSTEKPVELEQYSPKLSGLQLTGPLELSGTVRALNSKIFIQRMRLQAQKTDVAGEVIVDLGLSPPRISATLNSSQFITSLIEADQEGVQPGVEKTDPGTVSQVELEAQEELSAKELGERFKAYTSSIQIETDWVDELDFYLSYTATKAQIGDYAADNLALTINAREGIFNLIKYQFLLEGRPISFSGLIDTNMSPPKYEFAGELKGDSLETLLNVDEGLLEGGELSGHFELKSEGENIGHLIEHLDGNALVIMGPLTIRSNALNYVSSSVFAVMLSGLLSKQEDKPASLYECGVLGVDINDGVARMNRAFAMQAKDYNLAGNGTIDLNTGAVNIKVNPKARKGIGLSISTIVGGFRIKGNMATPDFGLGGGSFISAVVAGYALTPVVAAGAASNPVTASLVATGFLLTGFIDRMTASNYTCENTLKRIERNRLKASAPPGPAIEY